jgi:hypothetical protein
MLPSNNQNVIDIVGIKLSSPGLTCFTQSPGKIERNKILGDIFGHCSPRIVSRILLVSFFFNVFTTFILGRID